MGIKILGDNLPNLPWYPSEGCETPPIWRYKNNPIINRNPSAHIARVFNSSVMPYEGQFIGVFRADHRNTTPLLHVGHSKDGLDWNIDDSPICWLDEEGKPYDPAYAYDPRVTKIENRYYIVWCTDFGGGPALGLGFTDDFKTFVRIKNPFIPFNRNGVLFPRKVNGKYLLLSRPSDGGHTAFGDIYISESPDLTFWGNHRKVMSRGGSGWWQGLKIGAGSVPIETDKGWLMFYHGVTNTCNGYVYSIGVVLLDISDPSLVKLRSRDYLLTPEKPYEVSGFVPNVCFPCATLCDAKSGKITLYYGAADTYTAVAFTTADQIYDYLSGNSELVSGDREPVC